MGKKTLGPATRPKAAPDLAPREVGYVASLDPHDFARLRNPVTRRPMAPRVALGRVAATADLPVGELLEGVAALSGVAVEPVYREGQPPRSPEAAPPWVTDVESPEVRTVDLLPLDDVLDADPTPPVMRGVKGLSPGGVLLIKHRWETQHFYDVWSRMGGLGWCAERVGDRERRIRVRRSPSHRADAGRTPG